MHYNSAKLKQMNDSEKSASTILDHLATAVLLFDRDMRLVSINPSGEDLLSISNRRAKGFLPHEVLPEATRFTDMIKSSIETGHPYAERCLTLNLQNAGTITVDCRVTPILDDQNPTQVIVEMVDAVSMQRVLHEENLTVLHDAAKESVRGMAHEIKNPLGGIRGAAQLLERELNNEDLIEYTQIIIQESDRLRNFIDRMLSSDRKLTLEDANIHELLEYVCNLLEAEYKNIFQIERDYDPSLPNVSVDREQILQVLLNVVRNAAQAIGESGQITVRTRAVRQCTINQQLHRLVIQIDIIDNGPGIPPEIENGIFYPMITGRADGTGLGLSIAQSLVNLHGGIINYERKDEKTRFSIFLPIYNNHD